MMEKNMPEMPAGLANVVRKLAEKMRGDLENGETPGTLAFVVRSTVEPIAAGVVPVDSRSGKTKDISALAIRLLAEHIGADIVVIFMDAWALKEHAKDFDEFEKKKAQYQEGSLKDHPDRIDVLQVTVETPEGFWFTQAPLRKKGKGRTFDSNLQFEMMHAEGRFVGLLPQPKKPAN